MERLLRFFVTSEERKAYYYDTLHAQLTELAAELCNRSEIGDEVLHDVALNRLRELYEEETARGYWHPYLTESLADFETDLPRSIQLYGKALAEAKSLSLPTQELLVCMAQNYAEMNQWEQIEACLRDAEQMAASAQDVEVLDRVRAIRAENSSRD